VDGVVDILYAYIIHVDIYESCCFMETKPECYQGFYCCPIDCVRENLSIDFAPNIVCGQVIRQVTLLVAKLDQVLHFDGVNECWKIIYQSLS